MPLPALKPRGPKIAKLTIRDRCAAAALPIRRRLLLSQYIARDAVAPAPRFGGGVNASITRRDTHRGHRSLVASIASGKSLLPVATRVMKSNRRSKRTRGWTSGLPAGPSRNAL